MSHTRRRSRSNTGMRACCALRSPASGGRVPASSATAGASAPCTAPSDRAVGSSAGIVDPRRDAGAAPARTGRRLARASSSSSPSPSQISCGVEETSRRRCHRRPRPGGRARERRRLDRCSRGPDRRRFHDGWVEELRHQVGGATGSASRPEGGDGGDHGDDDRGDGGQQQDGIHTWLSETGASRLSRLRRGPRRQRPPRPERRNPRAPPVVHRDRANSRLTPR